MALAPRTVQNMPDCLSRPTTVLHAAATYHSPKPHRAYKGEIPAANPAAKASRNGETSAGGAVLRHGWPREQFSDT
jgi:hypothetical protein